jgi:hypothetical protein
MPWMKLFFVLLLLSVGCLASRGEQLGSCSKKQALVAENSVGGISSWSDLERFFNAHKSCDDGLISEGVSDRVGHLLKSDFDGFMKIAGAASKNEFKQFVIRHVDESLDEDTLHSIFRHTDSCNESDEICETLRIRAQDALDALSDP